MSSRNKIAGQIPPSLGNISDDRTHMHEYQNILHTDFYKELMWHKRIY